MAQESALIPASIAGGAINQFEPGRTWIERVEYGHGCRSGPVAQ